MVKLFCQDIHPLEFFSRLSKTNLAPEAFMIRDYNYSVISCSPENLITKKGIDTNIHYPYSLSKLKVFKNRKKTYTPISNKICNELISLPIYPELEDKKIIYTSKSINRILK